MSTLVLDATTKSITALMSGAAALTNPDFVSVWADSTSTTFTEGSTDGTLNGTTPVTIVAAPAASTQRAIREINIYNRDTAPVTITLRYVSAGGTRILWSDTLAIGDQRTLEATFDNDGAIRLVSSGVRSLTVTSPLSNTGTAEDPVIALTGIVGVNHGGTGADLSATGGTGQVVMQEVLGNPFTVRTLTSADLPTIAVAQGGTGRTSLTNHAALIGAGTSAVNFLAPSTARNVMISDGTDWTSRAIADADLPTTLSGHTITGGTINNAVIGGSTPAAGTFTSLAATALSISGTGGGGFVYLPDQSSNPSTPTTGVNLFSNASHRFGWKDVSGHVATLDLGGITGTKDYVLPNVDSDTFVMAAFAQSLTNKSLVDATTFFVDDGDATKIMQFQLSGITTGTTRTLTVPDANLTLVGTATTQILTNKSLVDASTLIVDDGDNTKAVAFQVSGITTATTRTWTFIDASDTFVGINSAQTLAAKTLTTPTIASFTNATHNHTNAAGGGQLTDAALSSAVTVAKGGTNLTTLTAHAALIGNGTGNVLFLAPGTATFVMISDGTDWTSRALVNTDLPTVNAAHGGTGLTTLTSANLLVGAGTGNVTFIAPGTADNFLTSNGSVFASTPAIFPMVCELRLTLTSGTPVTTADVTGATNIFVTPYKGNRVAVFDTAKWLRDTLTEQTVAVPSTIYRGFDVYVYDNAGVINAETLNWNQTTGSITGATNATPVVVTHNSHGYSVGDLIAVTGMVGLTSLNGKVWRVSVSTTNTWTAEGSVGNGAYTSGGADYKMNGLTRATALTTQNGVLVKTGDTTRRYVGSGMTGSTSGQMADSVTLRSLYNYYNRVKRNFAVQEATSSWAYGTNAWRAANNTLVNRVEFFMGWPEDKVRADVVAYIVASGSQAGAAGIGYDSTVAIATNCLFSEVQGPATSAASWSDVPTVGYHYLQWIEAARSGVSINFEGRLAQGSQSGMTGEIWC